ncbi:RES family NAD+ phosphorylase [Halomonas organivorans]|uniref:RES domain-containing protein n=1 Tax=Halomonas organivorans TaxID=257772 RepID=A0A7W5G617_9GAMM|nr:hypothetical protein [Halomonas organivorans]
MNLASFPRLPERDVTGYRLVNSKFPPIHLFDDVADEAEFEALYALQAMTNPRLLVEAGDLGLIARDEIPFGIPGCAYATAPFTHVNPAGSRFGDGSFGVLYLADSLTTAIEEVRHHQQCYWQNVPQLHYERFTFRGLRGHFDEQGVRDALSLPTDDSLLAPSDYTASRALGRAIHEAGDSGIRFPSVRRPGATCWGLMTPRRVRELVQTRHYEMIWNGRLAEVNQLSSR